jgi:hypothetical protein
MYTRCILYAFSASHQIIIILKALLFECIEHL